MIISSYIALFEVNMIPSIYKVFDEPVTEIAHLLVDYEVYNWVNAPKEFNEYFSLVKSGLMVIIDWIVTRDGKRSSLFYELGYLTIKIIPLFVLIF